MIKIGLFDVDVESRSKLNAILSSYACDRRKRVEVETFTTPTEMIISRDCFDAYFVDIESVRDGKAIELCEHLREVHPDILIACASYDQNDAFKLFDLHPTALFIKPVQKDKIYSVLDALVKRISNKYFFLHAEGGDRRLKVDDLLYVDIQRRNFCYHMRDDTCVDGLTIRTSFAKELKSLVDYDDKFIFISPALLINKDEIEVLNKDNLTFKNGKILKFPASYYNRIADQWAAGGLIKK